MLTYNQFINESKGINSEIKIIGDELNTFIANHILNEIHLYDKTKYKKVIITIDNEQRNVQMNNSNIVYNLTYDYNILNFEKIEFNITTIIDSKQHNILDNSFDLNNSIRNDGTFIPIINLIFYLSNTDYKNISKVGYVSSAIHEIQHVFEFLTIVNKNISYPKSQQSNFKLLDVDKTKILDLYYFVYICFKHEIRARVAQIYELLKEIKSKNLIDYENFIKNTYIQKTINELYNFNCLEYMTNFNEEEQIEILNQMNLVLNTKYKNVESQSKNIDKWFKKTSLYYKEKLLRIGTEAHKDFINEKILGLKKDYYLFL